jgi:hypothetical protein
MIILAVALGALYTFIDFDTDRLIPESCSIGDSFNCLQFKMNRTDGIVSVLLENKVGTEITMDSLICKYNGIDTREPMVQSAGIACGEYSDDNIICPGEKITMFCNVTKTGEVMKKKSKMDITVIYYKKDMSFPSSSDGFISGQTVK